MPVKDYEAFVTTVTHLRLNPPYQAAEAIRRRSGSASMAAASAESTDQAAVLLLIGTWERIAIMASDLSPAQRSKFFRCAPVKLMWDALRPAIDTFGGTERFAPEFEKLSRSYESWLERAEAKEFRSVERQTICAMFA
jgi:hypothetical protein